MKPHRTLTEIMRKLDTDANGRGWYSKCHMEHTFGSRNLDDVEVPDDMFDCDMVFTALYGSNEGIYLDATFLVYEPDGTITRTKCGCCKTCGEDLETMEQMGLLSGRLTWLFRHTDWDAYFNSEK